ncbi:MAG: hypothetical protein LBJ60_05150 [Tannerellaceae bacterium]|nr:hypothetical protein [Tannerellaceae bacterium]
MKKLYLIVATLSLLLASCGSSTVKFNDTIIGGLEKVENELKVVADLMYDSEYDNALLTLDSLRQNLIYCARTISALNCKSGEQLKAKSLELLKLIETEFIPGFTSAINEYKRVDDIEDEEQIQAAYDEIYDKIVSIQNKYDQVNKELMTIQEIFAKENNISLIPQ